MDTIYFEKLETAICQNIYSNMSEALVTSGEEYTVLAFNPETDMILISDDFSDQHWVEGENFLNTL